MTILERTGCKNYWHLAAMIGCYTILILLFVLMCWPADWS